MLLTSRYTLIRAPAAATAPLGIGGLFQIGQTLVAILEEFRQTVFKGWSYGAQRSAGIHWAGSASLESRRSDERRRFAHFGRRLQLFDGEANFPIGINGKHLDLDIVPFF